jgi:DNA-binding beta-propeller fold protein YncE
MSMTPHRTLFTAGILAAILLVVPFGTPIDAGEPAGLGLRLVESSDAADPFSPRNDDGRFDLNTLRAIFAVGPLGRPREAAPAPGDDPGPMRRDLEHRAAVVRLHYTVTSPAGTPVFVADVDLPVGPALNIVHLPVDGGGVAPFARVVADIPWDGRDAAGAFMADGTYPTMVSGALHLDTPGQGGASGTVVAASGSVTVDNSPPDVDPRFPPPVSLTDAEQVAARIRATDPSGMGGVSVNGWPAHRYRFHDEWGVIVLLMRGDNDLRVVAEDTVGNRTEAPFAGIRSEAALLYQPYDVAYDPMRDRALLADLQRDEVVTADLVSGERGVLSGPGRGAGPDLPRPSFLDMDRARDRALVFGRTPGQSQEVLMAVDPVTGDRTVVSVAMPQGVVILKATDTAVDEANDRLLVCDRWGDAVIGIDLETGARSVVSGAARGTGPILDEPFSLAVDPVRGVAFVTRLRPENALLAVDLATGDRTLVVVGSATIPGFNWVIQQLQIDPVSGRLVTMAHTGVMSSFDPASGDHVVLSDADVTPPVGSGPPLLVARGLGFDEARERLLVTDERRDELLAVNRTTGDRSVVSGSAVGSGPPIQFSLPNGIAVDPMRQRLFYPERASLWAVDLLTGARDVFSGMGHGVGYPLERPTGLDYDPVSDGLYLTDSSRDVVYLVDPSTGDRTLVSGDKPLSGGTVGSGDPFANPFHLAVDTVGGRLLVDDGDTFVLVRLDNGDRTILAERGVGSIPDTPFNGMAWDADSGRFLTAGWERLAISALLLGIDPLSGHGDVISDAATGTGLLLSQPADAALDQPHNRALVVDRDIEGIVAIDLISGARLLVSGGGLGSGPRLAARSIDADAVRQMAYVSNSVREELIAVDLVSRDRVIVAK